MSEEFNLAPVFRLEYFIDAVLNSTTPPTPFYREEFYLAKMAGMDVDLPEPVFRREKYFAKLAGMDVEIPYPVNRDEFFLAAACGMEIDTPDPVFREEFWLNELASEGQLTILTGSIVSFVASKSKAINSLTVTIEPQQDLTYGDPYPAGGSKNLIPDGTDTSNGYQANKRLNADGTTTNDEYFYISEYFAITAGETYTFSNKLGTSVNPSLCFYDENKEYISGVNFGGVSPQVITAPANAVYCRANQYYYDKGNIIQLELGSTPTTVKPYSNICPITGFTEANIVTTNTNLLGGIDLGKNIKSNIPSAGYNDIGVWFAYNSAAFGTPVIDGVKFKANTRYTFILSIKNATIARSNLQVLYTNGTYENIPDLPAKNETVTIVVVTAANKTVSSLRLRQSGGTTVIYYDGTGVFEGVHTAADYKPYGKSTNISWQDEAGTVYGGTLTINQDGSVDLVANKQYFTDNGTNIWGFSNSSGKSFFYFSTASTIRKTQKPISNMSKGVTNTDYQSLKDNEFAMTTSPHNYVNIRCDSITSLADFKTMLSTTPIEIVFDLVTPVTYHLDSIEALYTLVGTNNIWCDISDSISVTASGITPIT